MQRAKEGGSFLSNQTGQLYAEELSLATDTAVVAQAMEPEPQYEDIARYLDSIVIALENSLEGKRSEELDVAVKFFDSLGEILGSRVDRGLRESSSPRQRLALA